MLVDAPIASAFLQAAGDLLAAAAAGTMVHAGIKAAYDESIAEVARIPGVAIAARGAGRRSAPRTRRPTRRCS